MKRSKIIGVSLLLIGLIGFAGYNYILYGGARDLASEDATYTVDSKIINAEFSKQTDKSNSKYLDKAIAVIGTITDINPKQVILDQTIVCNLTSASETFKVGQTATVKGRVVGYDDLMGELKLDQCNLIKPRD